VVPVATHTGQTQVQIETMTDKNHTGRLLILLWVGMKITPSLDYIIKAIRENNGGNTCIFLSKIKIKAIIVAQRQVPKKEYIDLATTAGNETIIWA